MASERIQRRIKSLLDYAFEYLALFDTPNQAASRVQILKDNGVENLILFVNYGSIETRTVKDSLEMFPTEIMSRFAH